MLDKLAVDQYGVPYKDLVSAVRRAGGDRVAFVRAIVASITLGDERQIVRLANSETIDARLVIIANGANQRLRRSIGMTRRLVSPQHSTTVGFDIARTDEGDFPFDSLTYFAERPSDRLAYLTLFRIGASMRANLMTYRQMSDPQLETMARLPESIIAQLMPNLRAITGDFVISHLTKPRPVDLVETRNLRMAGVVVIGDAFANSCPAAGNGTSKIFNDVGRLCSVYIPRWFATPGMGAEKIGAFYNDSLKQTVDSISLKRAMVLRRASIDERLYWRLYRIAAFHTRFVRGARRRRAAPATGPARRSPLPSLADPI